MKHLIKFYNVFVLVVTIFIILFLGMFTVPRIVGIMPFVVRSGSMEPAVPTGSVVFTNTRQKDDIKVGDVITFGLSTGTNKKGEETGVYVTHRVNKIFEEDGLVQTKGDANNLPDGYLEMDAIAGVMVFSIPRLGFALDHLQENHGYLQLILLICVLNGTAWLINKLK